MPQTEQLVSLTEELMRFRSTHSRSEELHECAGAIAAYFLDSGLEVRRYERKGIPSLFITRPGVDRPKVLLNGHFDVVEADDAQFVPKREGDRLIGRGAVDMKSGVAIMMCLMKQALNRDWNVGLMLVGDEEVGGFNGTGYLTELGIKGEIVLIPDGGLAVHRVIEKEKGVLRVALLADGQPAHASVPWRGKNAIRTLADAIIAAEKAFTPLEAHPEDHWVTTCNFGTIEGGVSANQVPPHAKVVCDIRYTEQDSPNEIISRIQAVMPEDIHVEQLLIVPPMATPLEHPLVKSFADCVKHKGREVEYSLAHGSSDARFFSKLSIPVVISQPDGADHHGRNEWVSISGMRLYMDVLDEFLDRNATI